MNTQTLALGFLAATAIGGVAWVFVYPLLSGEKQAESRRASIAKPEPAAKRQADKSQRSRRERLLDTLGNLDPAVKSPLARADEVKRNTRNVRELQPKPPGFKSRDFH